MAKEIVVPGTSKKKIEEHAVSLLREFQPSTIKEPEPINVEFLYEVIVPRRYGISTGYSSELAPGILGITDASLKVSYVNSSLSDWEDAPTRRLFRSTVAHEIKHCISHVQALNLFKSICKGDADEVLYRREKKDIKAYEDPEWQAYFFAGALLMPRYHILRLHEGGCLIPDIADIFDVNPAFVRWRLRKLGALN